MKSASLENINEQFLKLYKISTSKKDYNWDKNSIYSKKDVNFPEFLNLLTETGAAAHLAYFKNWMEENELIRCFKNLHYPILFFQKKSNTYEPVILIKENKDLVSYTFKDSESIRSTVQLRNLFPTLIKKKDLDESSDDEKILAITCFPNHSIFTNDNNDSEEPIQHKIKTFSRFTKLILSEKREIGYLYIYAIISGIIGLSLPLGIQSIIGFMSSGQVTTSVIVLISFVILGVLITGGMQVMQLSLAEHIQQRLFTKTAFEFAFRIPKIRIESVLNYSPPELINRFFDIITLQKGLAKILLEFSAAILQIILGLILLSLYHSSFIFFGIFLVTVLVLILRLTSPKGLKTSLTESKYKYMIANWLEEIARSLSTFKLAGYSNLPMEKTDFYVSKYLHSRKDHFKVLVTQYLSFVLFKTLITGGLLILGCILLLEKQINIGQFVASEIIIILVMTAVEKIILQLDTVYDVLTSIEKIGSVTDLPIEIPKGINLHKIAGNKGLSICIKDLKYRFPTEPKYIVNGIDLKIESGERICLSGYSSSGKTTFLNIILGFLTSYEGIVTFNNVSLRDINKNSLINLTGDNITQEDLFDGSILENISLGRNSVKLTDVLWAIECVDLSDYVHAQKEGIQTRLIGGKVGISESIARKIIIARSIVSKPRLLILEDFLLGLEKEKKMRLIRMLTNIQFQWTLILVSNDIEIMKLCNRTIILKQGNIVCDGTYEEIRQNNYYNELI